jgi:hypothetical protein
MKQLFLAIMLMVGPFAKAGDTPNTDKELTEIIAWLKSIDRYSYELSIRSEMKANSKEQQLQHSLVYSSNAEFIRYVKGENDCSFMNKQGMFKVDHKSQLVTYRQFESKAMTERVMAVTAVSDPGRLVDSVLFDKARIVSKKRVGDLIEYKLVYEKGYMIKSLELRFDLRKKNLLSVSYVVERYMNGIMQAEALVHQVVTMEHYKPGTPADLDLILANSNELKTYLQSKYTGYNIHTL